MAFDIEVVLGEMLSAFSKVMSAEWPKIQECAKAAFQEEREALEAIAIARVNSEINDQEMKSQLGDEKLVLEASLLACKVKSKAATQKAINAAMKVLSDAIKAALKAL
jgi:ribosome-binding ATPase YchF (GTP1/OBG family)